MSSPVGIRTPRSGIRLPVAAENRLDGHTAGSPGKLILGIDPSSASVAVVALAVGRAQIILSGKSIFGSPYHPTNCYLAEKYLNRFLHSLPQKSEKLAFVEAPVVGRGGAKTTMVQAFVSGAIQATLIRNGYTVYLINNQRWKKAAIGKGNATKEEIAAKVKQVMPRFQTTDQDLIDAAGVCMYGMLVVDKVVRLGSEI